MQNLNYNTTAIRNIDNTPPVVMTMSSKAIREREEYEEAVNWLLNTLAESRRISDEQGWLSQEDVERKLGYGIED